MTNKKSVFNNLPATEELLAGVAIDNKIPQINGHIHTPHSFSAFSSISQAFEMAKEEDVSVLGINDFYTTDGYDEFADLALRFGIFPLFNIEFMSLQKDLQEKGIRVNDPSNPGRTYFSGKGLAHPVCFGRSSMQKMNTLKEESNNQTFQMVDKLNDFLKENAIDIQLNAKEIKEKLAKNLFRERHIAQALRLAVYDKYITDGERMSILQKIYSGKQPKSSLTNIAAVENEIRSNLLKAGGAAFVPEDPKAFLSLEEVIDLIEDGKGIPCYPVLLDFGNGQFTDYEENKEILLRTLKDKNIACIELIPGRNKYEILKDFVQYFHENGFIVTFGSEHNTPQLDPIKISCGEGVEPDQELLDINYEGTAIIAAHQYLVANGKEGYIKDGVPRQDERESFVQLGKAVMNAFFNQENNK